MSSPQNNELSCAALQCRSLNVNMTTNPFPSGQKGLITTISIYKNKIHLEIFAT